jgi:hypothetical protein
VLDGPKKVGTGGTLSGATAPTSCDRAPVLELADRRDLQSRAHSGLPGSIPGWGTRFMPSRNLCDTIP